jgi:hypothetical protein
MSKFHEEFFNRGSPEHDKLMIKCLSKDGINKIIEDVGIHTTDNSPDKKTAVIRCKYGIHREFAGQYSSRVGPTSLEYCNWERCEHLVSPGWTCRGSITKEDAITTFEYSDRNISYETEVIMRGDRSSFILGYADAIISIKETRAEVITLTAYPDDRYEMCNDDTVSRILVEVKPTIPSMGDAIRQMKTYESLMSRYDGPPIKALVTYDRPDNDAVEYLQNEGIKIVTFERT